MTTHLVLIRHAKRDLGIFMDDSICPISPEGRLIQEKMSQKLKAKGIAPQKILYSPTKRTQETAEILGKVFQIQPEQEEALAIDAEGHNLIQKIPDPSLNQTVIMVGHAPSLMQFASLLTGKP